MNMWRSNHGKGTLKTINTESLWGVSESQGKATLCWSSSPEISRHLLLPWPRYSWLAVVLNCAAALGWEGTSIHSCLREALLIGSGTSRALESLESWPSEHPSLSANTSTIIPQQYVVATRNFYFCTDSWKSSPSWQSHLSETPKLAEKVHF